jgi:hypothetical protein
MRAVLRSALIASALLCAYEAQAINNSKGVTGANHARAHRFATGTGVTVGILDTIPFGIQTPNHLGNRLLGQYDFINKTPSQLPDPLNNPNDDHERLAGHIIASDDAVYTGVAPAAQIYLAAIYDPDYQSRRAAPAWLHAHHGVNIFSLSAGYGTNANGATSDALYWDWLMHEKNALLVSSAGNSGGQLVTPADSFNGIAVGAYDQATQARWNGSAYRLNGGAQGAEVRGKPDILAPGVWIGDGISYDGYYFLGTSFASPHVAGAAALLADYASDVSGSDQLDHRGMKAILLNSARKRQIAFPEVLSPQSSDSAAADATFDRDYLNCAGGGCALASSSSAALTAAWTPAGWTTGGSIFSVDKPLDDEQGAGFLDATRALINLAGGSHAPGTVAGIGWDQNTIQPTDTPSLHTYAIDQALAASAFLTATLTWDRIALESDGDGVVDDDDAYAFGELANLDLQLLNSTGHIVAQSISTTDNVEHLHIPLPAAGSPGDFKLQVTYNGGGILPTDFALAWWTSPRQLVAGDYDLSGTVDAADYDVWRANFGTSADGSPLVWGDGNGDGRVDAADFIVWRQHFGAASSSLAEAAYHAAAPERSSLLLALLSCAAIGLVRCR